MIKLGSQLAHGDTIKVWWKPKTERVTGFKDSVHLNSRRAVFASGRGMTVFDSDRVEVVPPTTSTEAA